MVAGVWQNSPQVNSPGCIVYRPTIFAWADVAANGKTPAGAPLFGQEGPLWIVPPKQTLVVSPANSAVTVAAEIITKKLKPQQQQGRQSRRYKSAVALAISMTANVPFWHFADMEDVSLHVGFRGSLR
jgi:hypothetical protein